jgi:choline dehydrogenase
MTTGAQGDETYDYIVVGSGAGGGPLSANLARAGYRVLLLEAGSDYESLIYTVPAFHGLATEDPNMKWDFFVKHYSDPLQQRRDTKYNATHGGILYPRAGTLGGCTAHHALITVAPPDSDWDAIAAYTGDTSWGADRMRQYFERLERCAYVPRPAPVLGQSLSGRASRCSAPIVPGLELADPRGHGFEGWLGTAVADPRLVLQDGMLLNIALATAGTCFRYRLETVCDVVRWVLTAVSGTLLAGRDFLGSLVRHVDPNDREVSRSGAEGLVIVPLSTRNASRNGPREYIRETQRLIPDRLIVRMNCLATRVMLDEDNTATGVEYLAREHLYHADPRAQQITDPERLRRTAHARREVILAAGAFNTPQLLMLSGIGPADELRRFGIRVRVDRPGVGRNLQDRYEIGVTTEMRANFQLLQGLTFRPPKPGETPDAAFSQWQRGTGIYATNGVAFGVVKRSSSEQVNPDLFIFGLPGYFAGYFPGYSRLFERKPNHFTWVILKAHTRNRGGTVTLRSADPTDVPEINFHYFGEGTDVEGADLRAVVDGVRFARAIMNATCGTEILPGINTDTEEEIRTFVQNEAWGHHASCTCAIGRLDEPTAVVDSNFRVFGTPNLRVVDASVFPRIPGFFIVAAVYMVSEKASDVIIRAAREAGNAGRDLASPRP